MVKALNPESVQKDRILRIANAQLKRAWNRGGCTAIGKTALIASDDFHSKILKKALKRCLIFSVNDSRKTITFSDVKFVNEQCGYMNPQKLDFMMDEIKKKKI